MPENRKIFEKFKRKIYKEFSLRDIEVVMSPTCRVKDEFKPAVQHFENENVDAIVTLHLAYSPSLESINILAETTLPIIILDTTPDYNFSPGDDSSLIFSNHGIHGVMDMCNLLQRNGKDFQIEAGHWKHSDVIDRVVKSAKAAKLATFIQNSRIGIIGKPFVGMADFQLPYNKLKETIGIEVIESTPEELEIFLEKVTEKELKKELDQDKDLYITDGIDDKLLKDVNRVGLAISKWMNDKNLSAFTVDFNEITNDSAFNKMPFFQAGKAMAKRKGYAGEGDVLTASLMATLASEFPETSFVEIFCPGWKTDTLLLSHMGEMNLNLCADKPKLIKFDSNFVNQPTLKCVGCFKPGNAIILTLAPIENDKFRLIISPVKVLDLKGKDKMDDSIHGWIKPKMPISNFLKKFSQQGGIHHQVMVYNADIEEIKKFAEIMQWDFVIIK